jgi:predicted aspartyl protease
MLELSKHGKADTIVLDFSRTEYASTHFRTGRCPLLTAVRHWRPANNCANTTPAAPGRAAVDHVTVPLLVEGNRPFIDLTFYRPDGSKRSARFLIDSGGGGFLITQALARDLGIRWGATSREDGTDFAGPTVTPKAFVGEFPLELNPERVLIEMSDNILTKAAPGHADGLFPGHVLAQYHVVFDYPKLAFTLARPGVLTPKGDELPMPVGKRSGFPRTEIEVAGKTYGFLLDTGASFTMVSEVLLKSWGRDHQDWRRELGAVGEAATLGGQAIETMFFAGRPLGSAAVAGIRRSLSARRNVRALYEWDDGCASSVRSGETSSSGFEWNSTIRMLSSISPRRAPSALAAALLQK